jgi:hypothetical protein
MLRLLTEEGAVSCDLIFHEIDPVLELLAKHQDFMIL